MGKSKRSKGRHEAGGSNRSAGYCPRSHRIEYLLRGQGAPRRLSDSATPRQELPPYTYSSECGVFAREPTSWDGIQTIGPGGLGSSDRPTRILRFGRASSVRCVKCGDVVAATDGAKER